MTTSLSPEPVPEGATRFDRIAERIENGALAITMALLVGVAALQLVLRSAFSMSLFWTGDALRVLVLWLTLLGAIAAARADRHLRIDVVAKLLPHRARELMACAASLVTVGVAALLAYEAGRFAQQTYVAGEKLTGDIVLWPFLLIMPVAFALIGSYYLRNAWRHLGRAVRGAATAQ